MAFVYLQVLTFPADVPQDCRQQHSLLGSLLAHYGLRTDMLVHGSCCEHTAGGAEPQSGDGGLKRQG